MGNYIGWGDARSSITQGKGGSSPKSRGPTWDELKPRVDIMDLAAYLLGPAALTRGSRGKWLCPFHDDHDPSMDVDAKFQRFRCWSCNTHGDAMALLMGVKGLTFLEGLAWLREHLGGIATPGPARAPGPRMDRQSGPRGIPRDEAERLTSQATMGLDGLAAGEARDDLTNRGITRGTLARFKIGFAEKIYYTTRDGHRGIARGIIIPWYEAGCLVRVKVRQTGLFRGPRYLEVFGDGARVYPDPAAIWPRMPLVITEGELDCVVVSQALAGIAQVVTLGGTGSKPDATLSRLLRQASVVFLALDQDDAGRRAVSDWGAGVTRLTPPPGVKDWCDCASAGIDLGLWIMSQIGAMPHIHSSVIGERDRPGVPIGEDDGDGPQAVDMPADETGALAGYTLGNFGRERGPANGDPPAPARPPVSEPFWPGGPADDYDREERAAIMEFDGGLSRDEAERRAGLQSEVVRQNV